MTSPASGVVYTETVVWAAPEAYVGAAPYQIAIIDINGGERSTVRIAGDRVQVGDPVEFAETRGGVAFFRKLPEAQNG